MKTLLTLAAVALLAACTHTTPSREKEDTLIPTTPTEAAATAPKNQS